MKRKRAKLTLLVSIFVLLLGFTMYCHFENTIIEITEVSITNSKIPAEFSGCKIAHISDLHNAEFGENNKTLIDKLKATDPDIIVITGDIIDASKTNINIAVDFIEAAVDIAPVYYVTGNHEAAAGEYPALADTMKHLDVNMMDNTCIKLERNDAKINLLGLADPNFEKEFGADAAISQHYLEKMNIDSNNYTILLSHRPELFDFYVEKQIDLVFSGHAHGGQFRLPVIGGVIAPNQGLFPAYTSGVYEADDTDMIVSRGLGNSIIPVRINNNPEIIVVTLNHKQLPSD